MQCGSGHKVNDRPTIKDVFTLKPNEYVLSEDIFHKEYSYVFASDWICIGHISQFPEVDSYIKVRCGGEEEGCTRGEGGGAPRALQCLPSAWGSDLRRRIRKCASRLCVPLRSGTHCVES